MKARYRVIDEEGVVHYQGVLDSGESLPILCGASAEGTKPIGGKKINCLTCIQQAISVASHVSFSVDDLFVGRS